MRDPKVTPHFFRQKNVEKVGPFGNIYPKSTIKVLDALYLKKNARTFLHSYAFEWLRTFLFLFLSFLGFIGGRFHIFLQIIGFRHIYFLNINFFTNANEDKKLLRLASDGIHVDG